ncbi:LTA synthase family protein [Liquorilactobacillus capillatus]|uniref:Phosphoglycerol transferase alkaline phosphatase superfamily protein n=1 Tax=Liquorilactobacillus capillatus DSM 19910 TaxID=1423731 RepID=A0A0R1MAI3_9LACO|nr:LTA synthase family protein [Liquorilactobacillus capillatus]KRL00488.1 phosphoglycerol transferase alkaline phosphatase superfamily protein [Liquorilactobacillus capillatus DSM 19910]
MGKTLEKINTRMGFYWMLVLLLWLKTILAYTVDFTLGVTNFFQWFILVLNPLAAILLLLGISLFVRKTKLYYGLLFAGYLSLTAILYLNAIYFREFSDFITLSTVMGYADVNKGLDGSSAALVKFHDLFYWLDVVLIMLGFSLRKIKRDTQKISFKKAFTLFSASLLLMTLNLTLAEIDRPQLLTRTFDRRYMVKYLGINVFTVYDSFNMGQKAAMRGRATHKNLHKIVKYVHGRQVQPNPQYFGIAKKRNVIIVHLESFQQFLIDDRVAGQTVTPFLNKLYHDQNTLSFANFFHQVGQGKTSDAENMLETGTFGLPQGSLFTELGNDQVFQSAPAILRQQQGYTSAVFHGDVPSFWNRTNVYKNMGFQYFFSADYFNTKGRNSVGYGLKDKLLFRDSVKYLQYLQQPFYAKFITLTNHFPFELDQRDSTFPTLQTGNKQVNNYFRTANYLDQAVAEFFTFLKKSGLYNNSIIILYGDHYGISNSANPELAKTFEQDPEHFDFLGKKSVQKWSNWDNAQLQRVPFMIHIPGSKKGGILKQYGGEIDVLPTLLHLLGIKTTKYLQFGTDLLSRAHQQTVAFRDGDFVTPTFSRVNETFYDRHGQSFTPQGKWKLEATVAQKQVHTQLKMSDILNQENLLRFYHPAGFQRIKPQEYDYRNLLERELRIQKRLKTSSTSLFSKQKGHTFLNDYHTDAPELK